MPGLNFERAKSEISSTAVSGLIAGVAANQLFNLSMNTQVSFPVIGSIPGPVAVGLGTASGVFASKLIADVAHRTVNERLASVSEDVLEPVLAGVGTAVALRMISSNSNIMNSMLVGAGSSFAAEQINMNFM